MFKYHKRLKVTRKRLPGRGSNRVLPKYKKNAVSVDLNCVAGTVQTVQNCKIIPKFLCAFAKITKSDYWLRHVCPSAWNISAPTGRIFMKFDIWIFFRKSVEKIYVSIKSDKNNGYFTWRTVHIYDNIPLNSSYNEKCLKQKIQRNSKHAFYAQSSRFCDNAEKIWHSRKSQRWQ